MMHVDKTTLYDLSIFDHNEEQSLLHRLNFCKTNNGRDWLEYYFSAPLPSIKEITERQLLLQRIISVHALWPENISNGSVLMIEKFYESQVDNIPPQSNILNGLIYKYLNSTDFSLIRYSITHFIDLVQGMYAIQKLLTNEDIPAVLDTLLQRIRLLLGKPEVIQMLKLNKKKELSLNDTLHFGYFIRNNYRQEAKELIELYSKLDAFYSMATACIQYNFSFPVFIQTNLPDFEARQLYHPLLPTPTAYNIALTQHHNFLFLTGANMAGKSTFIKAVGVGAYLAHIGMGVPAQHMQLSFFTGLVSNIHVIDNIIKGESYFFNEVQRIRKTIEQINDGKNWLVLIDELFKGTNVQDAMKCSTVVIEGLRKLDNASFILSTHLYEIGENLKQFTNIQFRYFETEVKDEELHFNYNLKEGISNDRIGYVILKREGVVDLLQKL